MFHFRASLDNHLRSFLLNQSIRRSRIHNTSGEVISKNRTSYQYSSKITSNIEAQLNAWVDIIRSRITFTSLLYTHYDVIFYTPGQEFKTHIDHPSVYGQCNVLTCLYCITSPLKGGDLRSWSLLYNSLQNDQSNLHCLA